jgi:hypothetical protein
MKDQDGRIGDVNACDDKAGLLRRPIIVIGPHRSGTTWLIKGMQDSSELACFVEPRSIWTYGNWFLPDDSLAAKHARPRIASHIHSRFERLLKKRGKLRVCDKTPSNALRIPFIREVFPDAQFLLILRDPRAVFRSTEEIKSRAFGKDIGVLIERVRDSSVSELPAFLSRVPGQFRKLIGKTPRIWGARPPGWKEWIGNESPSRIIARQWVAIVEKALSDLEPLPERDKVIINYEDLATRPEETSRAFLDALNVRDSEDVVAFFRDSARPERIAQWEESLSQETLEEIRPILEPMMQRLDYKW